MFQSPAEKPETPVNAIPDPEKAKAQAKGALQSDADRLRREQEATTAKPKGRLEIISHDKMSAYEAEAKSGVDHMIIAYWPSGKPFKVGYNQKGEMIRVEDSTGKLFQKCSQADLEKYRREGKQVDQEPGWHQIKNGNIVKLKHDNHMFSASDGVFLSQGDDDRAHGWDYLNGNYFNCDCSSNGTFIKTKPDGDIETMWLPDGTKVIPHYDAKLKDVDGQKLITSFDEISADGKQRITLVREGETKDFYQKSATGKTKLAIRKNVEISAKDGFSDNKHPGKPGAGTAAANDKIEIVGKEKMKDHPAELKEGVHHMIILHDPKNAAKKMIVGYNAKDELILVNTNGMLKVKLDKEQLKQMGKPNETPGWFAKNGQNLRAQPDQSIMFSTKDNILFTQNGNDVDGNDYLHPSTNGPKKGSKFSCAFNAKDRTFVGTTPTETVERTWSIAAMTPKEHTAFARDIAAKDMLPTYKDERDNGADHLTILHWTDGSQTKVGFDAKDHLVLVRDAKDDLYLNLEGDALKDLGLKDPGWYTLKDDKLSDKPLDIDILYLTGKDKSDRYLLMQNPDGTVDVRDYVNGLHFQGKFTDAETIELTEDGKPIATMKLNGSGGFNLEAITPPDQAKPKAMEIKPAPAASGGSAPKLSDPPPKPAPIPGLPDPTLKEDDQRPDPPVEDLDQDDAEPETTAQSTVDSKAAEKVEADRKAAEKVEADRKAAEKVEVDRKAAVLKKADEERLAKAKLERDALEKSVNETVQKNLNSSLNPLTVSRYAVIAGSRSFVNATQPLSQAIKDGKSPVKAPVLDANRWKKVSEDLDQSDRDLRAADRNNLEIDLVKNRVTALRQFSDFLDDSYKAVKDQLDNNTLPANLVKDAEFQAVAKSITKARAEIEKASAFLEEAKKAKATLSVTDSPPEQRANPAQPSKGSLTEITNKEMLEHRGDYPGYLEHGVDHLIIVRPPADRQGDVPPARFGLDKNGQIISMDWIVRDPAGKEAYQSSLARFTEKDLAEMRTKRAPLKGDGPGLYSFEKDGIYKLQYDNRIFSAFDGVYMGIGNDQKAANGDVIKGGVYGLDYLNGSVIENAKVTDNGTFIRMDAQNNVQSLWLADRTEIVPRYDSKKAADGKPLLASFDEISPDGKQRVIWTTDLDGKDFFSKDNAGNVLARRTNVVIDTNVGFSYQDVKAVKDVQIVGQGAPPTGGAAGQQTDKAKEPVQSGTVGSELGKSAGLWGQIIGKTIDVASELLAKQTGAGANKPADATGKPAGSDQAGDAGKADEKKPAATHVPQVGLVIGTDGTVYRDGKKVGKADQLGQAGSDQAREVGKAGETNQAAANVPAAGLVIGKDGAVYRNGKKVGTAQQLEAKENSAPVQQTAPTTDKNKGWVEEVDKNKVLNDAAFASEKATGVDHMRIAHYVGGGHLKLGYDQNNVMIRIDGNNVYRNFLSQADLDKNGITTGKTGWYIQESTGFRKMPFENYTFDEKTNTFHSQFENNDQRHFNLDGSHDKQTVSGAAVHVGAGDSVELIRRSDGSATQVAYQNDANGNKVVAAIAQFRIVGDQHVPIALYKRDGDKFILASNPSNQTQIPQSISNVKFNPNGNMSYEAVPGNGVMTIIRGDGAVIEAKSDREELKNTRVDMPEYVFDDQGRIKRIVPTADALARGARVRDFYYAGNTNELAKVIVQTPSVYPGFFFTHERQGNSQTWTCKCTDQHGREYLEQYVDQSGRQNTRQWWAPQGEHKLSPTGEYTYQDVVGQPSSPTAVEHHWQANGKDQLQTTKTLADNSVATLVYDAQGYCKSLETINKDGTPGMRWKCATVDSNGKPQTPRIIETNPAGQVTNWILYTDGRWYQEQSQSGAGQTQQARAIRSAFDFQENGDVTFLDEQGCQHIRHGNGTEEIKAAAGAQKVEKENKEAGNKTVPNRAPDQMPPGWQPPPVPNPPGIR